MRLSYSDFKTICTDKSLMMQYVYELIESNKYYFLFASDSGNLYECNINSIDHSSDVTDFESNLKGDCNKRNIIRTNDVPPETPAGKTKIIKEKIGDVDGSNFYDDTYVIPNGETLVIQHFKCGAEGDINKYSKVVLYYAPDGTVNGNAEVLSVGYLGDNFRESLKESFTGDGTKAIIMRRERMEAGKREIFGKWRGYY